jgi:AcrR family transcriptional regulator
VSSQLQSRRHRRKQETRGRILEAAVELFGEVGFEATKVADVCERADVARQTFFNHFPAKGDLLLAIYREGFGFVSATFDAACERSTTRERIAAFYGGLVEGAVEVGAASPELVAQILQATEPGRVAESQRIAEFFLEIVRRGLDLGDVTRRHAPEVLAQLVQGSLAALFSDWSARGGFDPRGRTAELAALVADALEVRPEERARGE